MALVASLWVELAALRQCMDNQERSASHNDGDEAEDKDEHPAIRRHLRSFWCFVTDTLSDYVLEPDPLGHAPCSIALAMLDHSFEEEHRSHTINLKVELATL